MANKILVTGADGFIGSHLTEELIRRDYDVRAFVFYNSFNSWGWLDYSAPEIKKNIDVFAGDIRDPNRVKKAVQGCDVVFHLAALIAIPYSYKAPDSYVDTNIKGTLNICQAALENGCKRVIHTSTSEVYGTAQYVPIDEKHPLQAQSPYSASKIGADSIAMSYFNALKLPLIIARPFNAYGPRQSARAIIPTIITQILSGKNQIKLGDITPTRDFTYVRDICNGFITLAESDKTVGEVFNIGSNYEISISETVNTIKKLMKSDVEFITDKQRIRPEKSEVFRLWCDNSKISKLTGFKPDYTLERGLKETINWFSVPENLLKYKGDIYNI